MGYGTVNTGYSIPEEKLGGYIEIRESIPPDRRRPNVLYGLVLDDFTAAPAAEGGAGA